MNRSLLFDPENPTAISEKDGFRPLVGLVLSLGIPIDEINLDDLNSRVLRGAYGKQEQAGPEQVVDIERTYFLSRRVNGLKVLNSSVIMGANSKGAITQFRVRWPALRLDARLANGRVVSREQMLERIVQDMESEQGCEEKAFSSFGIFLAYTPVRGLDGDEKDGVPAVTDPVVFVPSVVVYYLPASQDEGGNILEYGLIETDQD